MEYESEVHDIFVENELFNKVLEELENQHEINFMIKFGSLVSRIKIDYGSKGIIDTSKYIKNELGITYEIKDLYNFLKIFTLFSKGMKISYKLSMQHYLHLIDFNDIDFINNCITSAEKSHLNAYEFSEMLALMKDE